MHTHSAIHLSPSFGCSSGPSKSRRPLPTFILACHRDVDLTLDCVGSFVSRCKGDAALTIVSDGSLTKDDVARLRDHLPLERVVGRDETDAVVIPALANFPFCLKYREWCPWALKLLDIPIVADSDYVYVDGDLLFLRDFTGLDNGARAGVNLVSMQSYANIYSFSLFDRIAPVSQIPVIDRLNAGFLFVRKGAWNFELIERYLHSAEKHKRPFLSEQTAWAVMAAHTPSGHFSSKEVSFPQLAMDSNRRLKWRPVAMHFVGGTRHLISEVREAAARWNREESPVDLKVEPCRPLTRTGLLADLCRHRLLVRRCRRAGIFQ